MVRRMARLAHLSSGSANQPDRLIGANSNGGVTNIGDGMSMGAKKRIARTSLYNFGSPKVGNRHFVSMFNKLIPDAFRVVVDGDVVTGLPPGYSHVGAEVLIDDKGSGSIIINPSFVEYWLRRKYKTSVASHSLLLYRDGISGIIEAAEFSIKYADMNMNTPGNEDIESDAVKLALRTRALLKEDRKRRLTLRPASVENAEPIPGVSDAATNDDSGRSIQVKTVRISSAEESSLNEARHYATEYERNAQWLGQVNDPESSKKKPSGSRGVGGSADTGHNQTFMESVGAYLGISPQASRTNVNTVQGNGQHHSGDISDSGHTMSALLINSTFEAPSNDAGHQAC
jgi:hypothetical protein